MPSFKFVVKFIALLDGTRSVNYMWIHFRRQFQ